MPAVVALAERLIATPSPNFPGDERAVAAVVADALAERGLPPPRVLAKDPARPNLLVTLDLGPGGRHLCLSGHLDTKPAGDGWTVDPLCPTLTGDRLYGLGACDMKGGVAAMVEAAATIAREVDRGRLSLLFTADEEQGAAYGARYLAEAGAVEADAVLIGEPGGIDADFDVLHRVSRGIAMFTVRVEGEQGHSSLSDVRALPSATVAAARLLVAFADRFAPSAPPHPLWPLGPTVNAGVLLEGGAGFGIVPGSASFGVDVRLLPGMTRERFAGELEAFLAGEAGGLDGLTAAVRFEDPPRDWLPATEVPADAPLVTATAAALAHVTGRAVPQAVFPGTTDAAWLQGLAGVPTLPACGPGMLERAHRADEYVSVTALAQAVEVYREVARGFCAP